MALTDIKNPYTGLSTPDASKYAGGADTKYYHRDDTAYQHQLSQNLWDAQLAIMADDRAYAEEIYNKYNSPSAQVEQMRKAGLNPDLQGVSSQGMSAPQSSLPSSSIPSSSSSGKDFGLSLAQTALELLPQAISVYTGMKSSMLDIQQKELQVLKGADEIAQGEIGRQFSLDMLNDPTSSPLADISHIKSKKLRKKVGDAITRYTFDFNNRAQAKGFVYNAQKFGESERQGFLSLLSNFGYSIDDDTFVGVMRDLNEVTKSLVKKRSQKESDYYDNIDLTGKATMENAQWSNEETKAENDLYTGLLSKASTLMDSDNRGERTRGTILYIIALLTQVSGSYSKKGGLSFGF